MKTLAVLVLLLAACGSKTNPDACCTDAADCATKGLPDGSMCGDGLLCRGNTCVAEDCTSSAGCEAAAPFCVSSGLCAATCDTDSECPGFGQAPIDKFCSMGTCVSCLMDADCGAAAPVCDGGACRGCSLDSECSSGACADNGSCIDQSSIVYVNSNMGLDVGTCTQAMPCASIPYALTNALSNRSHVVLASGTYVGTLNITSMTTSAPAVTIHGGGAVLEPQPGTDLANLYVGDVATTVRDVTFRKGEGQGGSSITSLTAPCIVENVKVDGAGGFQCGANMTVENVEFINATLGLSLGNGSHLLANRVSIHGGVDGIRTGGPSLMSISNLEIYDLTGISVDLREATGTVQFATISRTAAAGSTPAVIQCTAGLTIQSSIVWTPGMTTVIGACSFATSIAGPSVVPGTINSDPMFLDDAHRDFHLTASSPAVDQIDSGPMTDLDGTPRPQGPKFDLGAFEYKP